jgi:type IV pilus assembly protein PilA
MRRAGKRSVASIRRLRRPSRAPSTRGFTLVELLITCAMIGLLSALGLVGYRKFIQSSQSSEARAVIAMIRGGEEAYKAEMLVYLGPSLSLDDYYPNPAPNDARMNFSQPGDARYTNQVNGWALLNISTDAPVRFGYATVAQVGGAMAAPTKMAVGMATLPAGVPWYTIQAINDHDGNGIYAVFVSSSVSGEIYSANEQE